LLYLALILVHAVVVVVVVGGAAVVAVAVVAVVLVVVMFRHLDKFNSPCIFPHCFGHSVQ